MTVCTTGREALLAAPAAHASAAISKGVDAKPRAAVSPAAATCVISSVARRPTRSASTPATSEATAPPAPKSAATKPAKLAV